MADYQKWAEKVWEKIQTKMSAQVDRIGDQIPYIPKDGKYTDMSENMIGWWTNGFWPGMLWQMYHATDDERFKTAAEGVEKKLDAPLHEGNTDHDTGFLWLHSAVANYRLTGNQESKVRGIHAANILAGRYNPDGQFIRSWNNWDETDRTGWMIIDCMMNIPLLYWATDLTHDPRYKMIALHHADSAMEKIIRPDGSSNHIVAMDPMTGEVVGYPLCQGYAPEGSWSRGQAWAIYGFALSAKHTGEQKYLDTAKKVAHYFIANCAQTGNIPLCDFRAPAEPVMYDTTAAAIAACGMLEIAEQVSVYEKPLYYNAACAIMKATIEKFANFDPEVDSMLDGGTVAYHAEGQIEVPIIYGDYFMIEMILRVLGKDFLIW